MSRRSHSLPYHNRETFSDGGTEASGRRSGVLTQHAVAGVDEVRGVRVGVGPQEIGGQLGQGQSSAHLQHTELRHANNDGG
jgi:hypothetical protein